MRRNSVRVTTAVNCAILGGSLCVLFAALPAAGLAAGYKAVEKEVFSAADQQRREEVRLAATRFYGLLKDRQFGLLYDEMPQECRSPVSRQEFIDAFDPAAPARALMLSGQDLLEFEISAIRLAGPAEAEVSAQTEIVDSLARSRRLEQRSLWVSRDAGWVCPECCAQLVRQVRESRSDALAGMEKEILRDEIYDFIRDD